MRVLVVAFLAIALTQSGCLFLAAGGAGYGGYKAGQDERGFGRQMNDATITSQVKTKLLADSEISGFDINVDTYEGVVTLGGHVENRGEADRAVQIARGVKGVHDVHSNLVVLSD